MILSYVLLLYISKRISHPLQRRSKTKLLPFLMDALKCKQMTEVATGNCFHTTPECSRCIKGARCRRTSLIYGSMIHTYSSHLIICLLMHVKMFPPALIKQHIMCLFRYSLVCGFFPVTLQFVWVVFNS